MASVHSHPSLHPETIHAMSSGVTGKATAVDELKALILQAEAGTGEIARHIEEAQFTPRHNAFTSLLRLASKSRQPEKAIEIFEAMQKVASITPNTFSYSALISALARVGNWEQAEGYFNELKERAVDNPDMKPNTVTYAAMISGKLLCMLSPYLAFLIRFLKIKLSLFLSFTPLSTLLFARSFLCFLSYIFLTFLLAPIPPPVQLMRKAAD